MSVFINIGFDAEYRELMRAITFAVIDCGFTPHCAEEIDNGAKDRLQKIINLIASCRFGIHDISMVKLDRKTRLPRFNMPFELGLFLGATAYEAHPEEERFCLIFTHHKYDYRSLISDISGHDIQVHNKAPRTAIKVVRNFLLNHNQHSVPGDVAIWQHYLDFNKQLPTLCKDIGLDPRELIFVDYVNIATVWLRLNAPPQTS